ncbi:MAG: hypothetical protein EZS28_021189, partial [Streblomastix strix]
KTAKAVCGDAADIDLWGSSGAVWAYRWVDYSYERAELELRSSEPLIQSILFCD